MTPPHFLIAGMGRSGSTAVDRMIAYRSGAISLGEIPAVFRFGLLRNETCSCGQSFRDCGFWMAVAERVPALSDRAACAAAVRLQETVLNFGLRNFLELRVNVEYAELLQGLMDSIRFVTGDAGFVDSSKNPHYIRNLLGGTSARPTLIHLVRDPVAVAQSMSRSVPTGYKFGDREMKRAGLARSSTQWLYANLAIERIARSYPTALMRIEDLRSDQTLAEFLTAIGISTGEQPTQAWRHHQIGGNPMRAGGDFEFRPPSPRLRSPGLSTQTLLAAPGLAFARCRYKYK